MLNYRISYVDVMWGGDALGKMGNPAILGPNFLSILTGRRQNNNAKYIFAHTVIYLFPVCTIAATIINKLFF